MFEYRFSLYEIFLNMNEQKSFEIFVKILLLFGEEWKSSHFYDSFFNKFKNDASAGNRTRAARVAGEHSTTEPPMLIYIYIFRKRKFCQTVFK